MGSRDLFGSGMAVIIDTTLHLALTAAPWFLLGLLAAGAIYGLLPQERVTRLLGDRGIRGIVLASTLGAPLPLCSCGALPTALALHRKGAGRGPSTAFLVSTPGIGVDSVILTAVFLGPLMALVRAAAAVATAIVTGAAVAVGWSPTPGSAAVATEDCCAEVEDRCGNSCTGGDGGDVTVGDGWLARLRAGLVYAGTDLIDDIAVWMLVGLVVAGALMSLVPPDALSAYGQGMAAMVLIALAGLPMYICAAAATPVAAGMIAAGLSPGTALVFLLAGPITSLATLAVLRIEFGLGMVARYVVAVVTAAVLAGLVLDAILTALGLAVVPQAAMESSLIPVWIQSTALAVLLVLAARPLRRYLARRLTDAALPLYRILRLGAR